MWFNPAQLTKTAQRPPANFANSANFAAATDAETPEISKLAELATSPSAKISVQEKVGAGETADIWLVIYPDGSKAEVHCTPTATLAQILETRPSATAELLEPVTPRTSAPMANDPDQRTGAERWPGLIQKGGE